MERIRGIEPPSSAWEADVLPLNYIRLSVIYHTISTQKNQGRMCGKLPALTCGPIHRPFRVSRLTSVIFFPLCKSPVCTTAPAEKRPVRLRCRGRRQPGGAVVSARSSSARADTISANTGCKHKRVPFCGYKRHPCSDRTSSFFSPTAACHKGGG